MKTLYILYNADASIMGKLTYACRKVMNKSPDGSECAACDITHGGLSLKETPGWAKVKSEIERDLDLEVVQWHRDEMSPELKDFVQQQSIRYPAVIMLDGDFKLVFSSSELLEFKGDPDAFFQQLKTQSSSKPLEASFSRDFQHF